MNEKPTVKPSSKKMIGHPSGVTEIRFQATGKPEPVISWFKDGLQILPNTKFITISDKNYFMLRITDLTAEDGGIYKLMAVNVAGFAEDFTILEIASRNHSPSRRNKKVAKIIRHPISVQCGIGQKAELDCEFEGEPIPIVNWFLGQKKIQSGDGIVIISNEHSSKLTIENIEEKHFGEYLCSVRNNLGEDLATAVIFMEGTATTLKSPLNQRKIRNSTK
uniref:Ig-like domain-containing protein n=1 Tax=Panagrolaimus sp. JU765 TaxID=591449 RepID=A0AC34Q8Y6_9BILA